MVARDWLQQAQNRRQMRVDFPVERCDNDPALFRRLNAVHKAIQRLPDEHRKTLEYGFRGGLQGVELARALRCEQTELPSRLRQAKDALQVLLAEKSA